MTSTNTETTNGKASKKNEDVKDMTEAPPPYVEPKGHMGARLVHFDPKDLMVITDEHHPLYDVRIKKPLKPGFIASIRSKGVLQAVNVAKGDDHGYPGKTVVVIGKQRYRAVIEANKLRKQDGLDPLTIPGTYIEANDKFIQGAIATENAHRLNNSPLERAREMDRLLAQGHTEEEIAVDCNVSKATVKNMIKLLTLVASARKAIDDGLIAVDVGYTLAGMERDLQEETVQKMLKEGAGLKGHKKSSKARATANEAAGKVSRPSAKLVMAYLKDVDKSKDAKMASYVVPVLRWIVGKLKNPPKVPGVEQTEE